MSNKWWLVPVALGVLGIGIAACGGGDDGEDANGLSGTIRIDGSSTVAPLSEAIAERFQEDNPDVKVAVGTSGTGGGFEKFCAGETDISDASRPIAPDEERACGQSGIRYEEVQVANDALTVVVHPQNPVSCMTVEQLHQVWGSGSDIGSWDQIEGLDADLDERLDLFGPGTDSGTFDFFTEAVNEEEGAQRTDFNNVGEDDNQTVTGVAGTPGGLGYFGFSYFQENEGVVKALEIDGGEGCVPPSAETVQDGSYAPLGRPLAIYPSAQALQNEAVLEFVRYYVDTVNEVAERVGFIGLTEEQLAESRREVDALAAGGAGGNTQ